jgi:hypothetical protein
MSTSVALGALGGWLRRELAGANGDRTVVLAGHYAIFTGGATAGDFLNGEQPPLAATEMIAFTKFTWEMACAAVASSRNAQLLVLVDDVTFVRPLLGDTRVREKLGDALASQYLQAVTQLPSYHLDALAGNGLTAEQVCKQSDARWTFSERELRIAHVRRLKALIKSGSAGSVLKANPDASEITVTLAEHGDHCLVQSGHTNCAGGYMELVASLYERGVRRLISLVPMRCLGPLVVGTSLANNLFALDDLTIVNVAVPDVLSDVPAAVMTTRGAALARETLR